MSTLFLFFAAFFPRLTLLVCYVFGAIPNNDTPLGVDFLCALFVPRLLIAWWAHAAGMHPLVVVIFVLIEACEKLRGIMSKSPSKSKSKE